VQRFRPDKWWAGGIILFKSFSVGLVLTIFPSNGYDQAILLIFVLFSYVITIAFLSPFRYLINSYMEVFQGFMLIMMLAVGSPYLNKSPGTSTQTSPYLEILMMIVFVVISMHCLLVLKGVYVRLLDRNVFDDAIRKQSKENADIAASIMASLLGRTKEEYETMFLEIGDNDSRIMQSSLDVLAAHFLFLNQSKFMRRRLLKTEKFEISRSTDLAAKAEASMQAFTESQALAAVAIQSKEQQVVEVAPAIVPPATDNDYDWV
jgi:hypothetical protein